MSDAFLAARPSAHAATDAPRPQRPPRRISHLFNDRDNVLDASLGDVSHASSSSTGEGDGSVATAPQSHAQRFVKGSTSVDTDVDRTPTRVSHRSTALQNRASKASLRKDWQGAGDEQPRQASQRLARATAYSASPSGDDGGLSAPRLRHQSSSTTIRSSEKSNEIDAGASASSARINESPRSERQKRSAKYEEEIQQMRSESRLASRDDDDDDDDRDRSFGRTAHKANDTTDTSGTEGSGPVIGNRRRKKSSTSSSGKKAAARAAQAREAHSSPPKKYSPRKDRLPSSSAGPFHSTRSPFATLTSPLRTESALEFASPRRSPTSRRLPLPNEFQTSRYRSDAMVDDSFSAERRRNSIDNSAREGMWPRGEELPPRSHAERRDERRNRQVSESPVLESVTSYRTPSHGESKSNGAGRVAVDANGGSRQNRYGSLTEGRERAERASGNRSVSDLMRQRKISTSSSVSQRSSGAPSDPNRPNSRVSLRRNYGRDVFDDGSAPPLPEHSLHPLSPRYQFVDVQQEQQSQATAQALREKQERIRETRAARGEDWQKEVDELQRRIDQLTEGASARPSHRETYSRSSSRASASAPRSSTSNVSSTPSVPTSRRAANRPSTEPRNVRGHRGASESLRAERNESVSRLGVLGGEKRFPVTPNMADLRAVSGSRMASGTQSSVGRYSSVNQRTNRSLSASTGSGPLHERNLLNSVDAFERFYLEARKVPVSGSLSNSSAGNVSEIVELVNRFRETSETAISINNGLRQLLQCVVECAIDAEVDARESDSVLLLNDIDKSLSTILRDSDEQMRSLSDGLLAFTRAEKERDRLRRMATEQSSFTGSATPRSVSRMTSLGLAQLSPDRDRSRDFSSGHSERRSSLDLRKSISMRDRDQRAALGGGAGSNTSLHAGENRSQASDLSSESRNSGDSGHHQRRRYTVLNESHGSSSTASGRSPTYPYSPSPNPSTIHGAATSAAASSSTTSTVQSMRRGDTSPTLDMHLKKAVGNEGAAIDRSTNGGSNISHSRSASELNLKHAFSAGLDSLIQRSPLLRRDRTPSASAHSTVRGTAGGPGSAVGSAAFPPSLSPRRPRLSFPKVSAIAVEATTTTSTGSTQSTSDNGDDLSDFNVGGGAGTTAAGGGDEVD